MGRISISFIFSLFISYVLIISMVSNVHAMTSYQKQEESTKELAGMATSEQLSMTPLPKDIVPSSFNELVSSQSLEPNFWDFDDAVNLFADTRGEYRKVWEPWQARSATHVVAVSDDRQFIAVGTGYLSDTEVHVYRWNPLSQQYVLVSQAGDMLIRGDIVDLSFCDIDSNGFIEIAAASKDGYVYLFEQAHIYDPIGSTENRFDLVWTSPRLLSANSLDTGDADLDGFNEIVVAGGDGRIHVYEFREKSAYPYSYEHTKILKEVFTSDYLGSPVLQVRIGDFDGDMLPGFIVGLRDGSIIVFENAGNVISTPSGPFPIAYDNYYEIQWQNPTASWNPIIEIQAGDVDRDGKTEAGIIAMGQDVFLLDTNYQNELILDRIVLEPSSWEKSGAYPIDPYMDTLVNASNVYFDGNLSLPEPMDWKDPGNKVSPYTSGMANKSVTHYSLLRSSVDSAWAVMDWGSYEEIVGSANAEPDIIAYLNTAFDGEIDSLNALFSKDGKTWYSLNSSLIWLSPEKRMIYFDVDPLLELLQWKNVRYMQLNVSKTTDDLEIIYWETARINMRLSSARSLFFSSFEDGTSGNSVNILSVVQSDGTLYSFNYVSNPDHLPGIPKMELLFNSYEDQSFQISNGGAWSVIPNPLYRPIPNWYVGLTPWWDPLTVELGISNISQITIGPDLHPVATALGDNVPQDMFVIGDGAKIRWVPNPNKPDLTEFVSLSQNMFKNIESTFNETGTRIKVAFIDLLYFPWEKDYPVPELLVSVHRPNPFNSSEGTELGVAESSIRLFALPDWQMNISNLIFKEISLDPIDRKEYLVDKTGNLQGIAWGLDDPLEMGTADFDADGLTDLVVSDGLNLYLFKQVRPYPNQNASLILVPGFFDSLVADLMKTGKRIENLQGIDYDNDGDADLLCGLQSRRGFTFFENIGTPLNPVWVEKRSFVHNRNPVTSFTNYDYEFGIIWENLTKEGTSEEPWFEFVVTTPNGDTKIFEPSYAGQQVWLIATYPEVKIILTNFYLSSLNWNWGFEYLETWSNRFYLANWTQAITTGILDNDDNREVIIADYDNNLYVFEHLSNNTYKIAYRSPDLRREYPLEETPYESKVLFGLDQPINRTIYEHAKFVEAGKDLDHDGFKEIICATERQIYWFEATGYNDEYKIVTKITLPTDDERIDSWQSSIGYVLNKGITAFTTHDDLDGNDRGEIIVAFNSRIMIFEVSPDNDGFIETWGEDIEGTSQNSVPLTNPATFLLDSSMGMPYGEVTAILSQDLDNDGFAEIVIGGKSNREIEGYPGFLRVLGTKKEGTIYYDWVEIWSEKNIEGFLERNYVTSLKIDDQNYDGKLELIVGHKYGFDVFTVNSDPQFTLTRVDSVSGSPSYPVQSYSWVENYTINKESDMDYYSSSITRDDSGYYYVAYSRLYRNTEGGDGKYHIFLAKSTNVNDTTGWESSFVLTIDDGGGGQTYSPVKELMPSLAFYKGYWCLAWVALKQTSGIIDKSELWIAWTDDFFNWTKFPAQLLMETSLDPSLGGYIMSPSLIPRTSMSTIQFALFWVVKGSPWICNSVFMVWKSNIVFAGDMPYSIIEFNIPGISSSTFALHSIAVFKEPQQTIYDTVVSVKYDPGEDTQSQYDLWYGSLHPGTLNYTPSYYGTGNWSRITFTYKDELFPSVVELGRTKSSILITSVTPASSPGMYEITAISGIPSEYGGYSWSDSQEINPLPYEFHYLRKFNGSNYQLVYDGRIFNETFSSDFYVQGFPEYNYFPVNFYKVGVPALTSYGEGFAMAYPFTFGDGYHWTKHGTLANPYYLPDYCGSLVVLTNPFSEFSFNNLKETIDLDVGDSDKDGKREILVASTNGAYLFELKTWTKLDSNNYATVYSPIWFEDLNATSAFERKISGVEMFDANGNGFEEIFIASPAGYVRAYEFFSPGVETTNSDVVKYRTTLTDPDFNLYDIDSISLPNTTIATLYAGSKNNRANLTLHFTPPLAGSSMLSFQSASMTRFEYAKMIPITDQTEKLLIVAISNTNGSRAINTFLATNSSIVSKSVLKLESESLVFPDPQLSSPFYHTPLDVDGDGKYEILLFTNQSLVMAFQNGSLTARHLLLGTEKPLANTFHDLNNDGIFEILSIYQNGSMIAWTLTGKQMAIWDVGLTGEFNGLAVASGKQQIQVLIGRSDGLIASFSPSEATIKWNLTVASFTPVFFDVVEQQGEELLVIISTQSFIGMGIRLRGEIAWIYSPSSSFNKTLFVKYDSAIRLFALLLGNTTSLAGRATALTILDPSGVVKAISLLLNSTTIVDRVTAVSNTFIGIRQSSNKITEFYDSSPYTYSTVSPKTVPFVGITITQMDEYQAFVDDIELDHESELFAYSTSEDLILVFAINNSGITPKYFLNVSSIDMAYTPILYRGDPTPYLVVFNYTHANFFDATTGTYIKACDLFDLSGGLFVRSIFETDFQNDDITEFFVELGEDPRLPRNASGFVRKLACFMGGSFTPRNMIGLGVGLSLESFSANSKMLAFVDPIVIGTWPVIYIRPYVRTYVWDSSVNITHNLDYTFTTFSSASVIISKSQMNDNALLLLTTSGEVYIDPTAGTGSSSLTLLYTLPSVPMYSTYYDMFYESKITDFRPISMIGYEYTDIGNNVIYVAHIGTESGPWIQLTSQGDFYMSSEHYRGEKFIVQPLLQTEIGQIVTVIRGKLLAFRDGKQLNPVSPYGRMLEDYAKSVGIWRKYSPEIFWYLGKSGIFGIMGIQSTLPALQYSFSELKDYLLSQSTIPKATKSMQSSYSRTSLEQIEDCLKTQSSKLVKRQGGDYGLQSIFLIVASTLLKKKKSIGTRKTENRFYDLKN